MNLLTTIFASRFWSLIQKEIRQFRHNKQLITLLILPPIIQILVYGFALNPDVRNLNLGLVDYSQTSVSRDLVSAFTENSIFLLKQQLFNEEELGRQVEIGQMDVGVVIPPEFNRNLKKDKSSEIQILIDGVNANTAGIVSGYINQMVQQYAINFSGNKGSPPINTKVIFLYNPGLTSSWFFVPGVMGLVLTIIGSVVSAIMVIKEKDTGTLEQLLMTPASPGEILLAKVVPLFVLLMGDVFLALILGWLVFDIPFRGSLLLFLGLSGLYIFVIIGVGIMLATFCQSQEQVVLIAFFVNLPIVQTSGAIAPIETMPPFFQVFSWFNPLRHYITITRGILLKGVGLEALWMDVLMVAGFAVIFLLVSTQQFQKQSSS